MSARRRHAPKVKILKREQLRLHQGVFARARDVSHIPGWEQPRGNPKTENCACVMCKYVGWLPAELPGDTCKDPRMSLLACSINQCEAESGQRLWPAVAEALWHQLVVVYERFPKARPRVRAIRAALDERMVGPTGDGWPVDLADALACTVPETWAGRKRSAKRPAWEWTTTVYRGFANALTHHWSGRRGYTAGTEHTLVAKWAELKRDHPLVAARSHPLRGFSVLTTDLREDLRLQLEARVHPAALALHLTSLALGISEPRIEKHRQQHRRHYPRTIIALPDNGRGGPPTGSPDANRGSNLRIYKREPPPSSEK
jgi:hypothetical protein